MQKTSQSSIRRENIEAVFSEIINKDGISRSEIAQETGLSLMTVGKVADLLTECGAAVQSKPATGKSGRRAGCLSVSKSTISLVCDISTDPLTAAIVNLRLDQIGKTSYDYDYRKTPKENLTEFFSKVSLLLLDNLRDKTLIGSAVIYSGEYDRKTGELLLPFTKKGLTVDPVACMKSTMGITPDVVESSVSCAVRSKSAAADEGLYLAFDVGFKLSGCIVYNGEIISRESELDLSSVTLDGESLDETLKKARSDRELADILGRGLGQLCRILKPRGVYIWSKLIPVGVRFENLMNEALNCPVIATVDGALAGIGGGAEDICKKWIEKNIFGETSSDNFSL